MAKSATRLKKLVSLSRKVHLFVAKGPAYHYIYGRWRLNNWLQKVRGYTFDVDNTALLEELKPKDLLQSGMVNENSDHTAAHTTIHTTMKLADYFQTRTAPVFFFTSADKEALVSLIPNSRQQATIQAADEITQNIFRFRRADPVQFKDEIDWKHCPQGNVDWTWDLNRHAYFETLGRAYWYTGDERYAQKFRALLLDWIAKNPAHVGQVNWTSVFEVAFRINTWLWAFFYFQPAAAFDQETYLAFLKGVLAHGRYLETNLEFHTRNNHLLLEAKSLAMLGILFPEFKEARRWQQRGLKILYEQIKAQVCSDGGHGERTTHYHRVITGELLELFVLLENNKLPIPAEIMERFDKMIEFELWVTKPNGLLPLLADSSSEDVHFRFSGASGGPVFLGRSDLKSVAPPLDETNTWLLGPERINQYLAASSKPLFLGSRAFPDSGYFIMRAGQATEAPYLVFDCGPFGYPLEPYHGHADALSFDLYAFGQTLLIDPGIYSAYLGQDWRLFFRGTRAHNTVVVDDEDQSILLDTRRIYRQAQTKVHYWLAGEHFDFVDGSHNGYERFAEPIKHRRRVFFVKPTYWVVIDTLTGQGQHCFDLYFHLLPGVETTLDATSGKLFMENELGAGLTIIPLAKNELQADIITGSTQPIQGWVSFRSGEKLPAPTLRYRQEGLAPVQFYTVLYPHPTGQKPFLTITALDIEVMGETSVERDHLTCLRIETDKSLDYLIVDDAVSRPKTFADYETDAQLLYMQYVKKNNKLAKVIMSGGRRLLFQDQPLLEISDLSSDFVFEGEKSNDRRGIN